MSTEQLLGYWFSLSVAVLMAIAGWVLGKWGFYAGAILSWLLVLALAHPLYRTSKKVRRKRPFFHYVALLLVPLFLGNFAAEYNWFQINDWIDNSLVYLRSELRPVRHFGGIGSKVTLDARFKSLVREKTENLKIYDHGIAEKILVSFDRYGFVLLDGKNLTPLFGCGSLLSSLQPDNSVIIASEKSPQTLTKAIIRDDGLYKVWERMVPGLNLHHWGDVFNGEIYYPGKRFSDIPDALSKKIGFFYGQCSQENSMRGTIHVFDLQTGKLKRSIDLLPILATMKDKDDALARSIADCFDPLHLNDVQIVKTEKHASFFPRGKVGDMLISLRNINAILLLDRDTLEVKWYVANKFMWQHAPRITDRGTLLVFDNLGSDKANGRSRIVEIGIASRKIAGFWEASGQDFFESKYRGKVTLLGDRIVVESQDSRTNDIAMFALDCPVRPISMACTKTLIFTGKSPDFRYDNAVFLENSSRSRPSS